MAIARPQLKDLIDQFKSLVNENLANSALARSDANVYSTIFAYGFNSLYNYIDYVANQLFADSADDDNLLRHASLWGIVRKPAVAAKGSISITTTNATIIPQGTLLQTDNKIEFKTVSDLTIPSAGTYPLNVEAVVAGANGNLDIYTPLTFVNPIASVSQSAKVVLTSGGSDIESINDLRARVLNRIKAPPHGGTISDYTFWTSNFSGVDIYKSWATASTTGSKRVIVRAIKQFPKITAATNLVDGTTLGQAINLTTAELTDLKNYLQTQTPVDTAVDTQTITIKPVALTISQLSPNTDELKSAIVLALYSFFADIAQTNLRINLSRVSQVISGVVGEEGHTLAITGVAGGAAGDVNFLETNDQQVLAVCTDSIKFLL